MTQSNHEQTTPPNEYDDITIVDVVGIDPISLAENVAVDEIYNQLQAASRQEQELADEIQRLRLELASVSDRRSRLEVALSLAQDSNPGV